MNEYHIRGIILSIEGTINDIPVFRTETEFTFGYQWLVRPFGYIRYQKLSLVTWHIVTAGNSLDQCTVIAPRTGIIVFFPDMMNLGGCNELTKITQYLPERRVLANSFANGRAAS